MKGGGQEDESHYHARIQTHVGFRRDILLRHEINSGEAADNHLGGSDGPDRGAGMGGGSFTSSRRTAFGQGNIVARVHEDVWDKRRGWKKNYFQAK